MHRRHAVSLALLHAFAPGLAFGLGPMGPEVPATATLPAVQFNPSIAAAPAGSFVIAYESPGPEVDADRDIWVQRFASSGRRQGNPIRVNTYTSGNQLRPSVAMNATGDFVVGWESKDQDGSGYGVYARSYTADGQPRTPVRRANQVTTGTQVNAHVAVDASGNFVVAWDDEASSFQAKVRCYDVAGNPTRAEFPVSSTTTRTRRSSTLSMSAEGDFVVAWTEGGYDSNIAAQRFTPACQHNGDPLLVAGDPIIADGNQENPAIGLDADGDFVVAWESEAQDGNLRGIYARRYRADGIPKAAEFRVNTTTTGNQVRPRVGVDAVGDFVVSWDSAGQEDGDAGNIGVYAARYGAAGKALGPEFRVNQTKALDQKSSAVALDADGDVVVAWSNQTSGIPNYAIYTRRFQGRARADLRLNQTDSPDPKGASTPVTYTLHVSNLTPPSTATQDATINLAIGAATNVRVVSRLPEGSSEVSTSGEGWKCVVRPDVANCRYTRLLLAGQNANPLKIQLQNGGSGSPPTIRHVATVYADQVDPDTINNRDVETTGFLN